MEFRILGALDARVGPRTVALGGHRQQLVLAVLVDHANEAVPTDRLIDAVWGDAPPTTARKTLQVYVSRLRQALGDDAIDSRGDGYVLRDFHALRRVLDEELGIEPTPELQGLHERILRQDPTLTPRRSAPSRRCSTTRSRPTTSGSTGPT